jgi:hypothetical protein
VATPFAPRTRSSCLEFSISSVDLRDRVEIRPRSAINVVSPRPPAAEVMERRCDVGSSPRSAEIRSTRIAITSLSSPAMPTRAPELDKASISRSRSRTPVPVGIDVGERSVAIKSKPCSGKRSGNRISWVIRRPSAAPAVATIWLIRLSALKSVHSFTQGSVTTQ